MSDGLWGRDGERLSPHLRRNFNMRGNNRPGALRGSEMGLVVKVHHKDDETNLSGSYAEYDILLMNHLMYLQITNIPVLGTHSSVDSGEQATLTACSSLPDVSDATRAYQNFYESDGDLVLVEFVSGRFPVIVGTLNHIRSGSDLSPWHTESAEGEVRALYHKDSFIKMKSDGKIQIELKDQQEIQFTIDGDQILRLWDDGGTLKIDLGDATVTERLVMGDAFKTWFDTNVASHKHSYTTPLHPSVLGSTGSAVPNLSVTVLTDKVKTQA